MTSRSHATTTEASTTSARQVGVLAEELDDASSVGRLDWLDQQLAVAERAGEDLLDRMADPIGEEVRLLGHDQAGTTSCPTFEG
jgi:hypothetical protein